MLPASGGLKDVAVAGRLKEMAMRRRMIGIMLTMALGA